MKSESETHAWIMIALLAAMAVVPLSPYIAVAAFLIGLFVITGC